MVEKARFIHYLDLQGGMPTVNLLPNGLTQIIHAYREDCPTILTHINPEKRGVVVLDTKHGPKEFEVAKLWEFEGKPCETQSIQNGGLLYNRLK